MQSTLMQGGMDLMLYGMGTVFVFLTVLVFATSWMSALVRRFAPVPMAEEAGASEEEVAAITAAIVRHRGSGR